MPAPKAPVTGFVVWTGNAPDHIGMDFLLKMRRKTSPPLTEEQIKKYSGDVRGIVEVFIGLQRDDPKTRLITLTEQNKVLGKISRCSNRVVECLEAGKDYTNCLKKLKGLLDVNKINKNTLILLTKHLQKKGIRWFKDFLDMLEEGSVVSVLPGSVSVMEGEGWQLDLNVIPFLKHLASLNVSPETNHPRWANPDLAFLVTRLAPIWCEVTGRAYKTTGEISDSHKYRFYEWINEILKGIHCHDDITHDKVNEIAKRIVIQCLKKEK